MEIKNKDMLEKLIWALTTCLMASFYIFDSYSWGKYLLAIVSVLVFLISTLQYKGRISLTLKPFHVFITVFLIFCFISALWSWSPNDAITKGFTIVQILICFSLIYSHYQKSSTIEPLLAAIMWAGYIVSIYSFIAYGGFNNVISMLVGSVRLNNNYTNINSIGMIAAIACVIQVYRALYKKLSWSVLGMVPAFIMILASQSRKALVILIMGILAVFALKNFDNRKLLKTIFKVILLIILAIILFKQLSKIEIFHGIASRMDGLFAMLTGEGKVDNSAFVRSQYIKIGWQQFLKTPIGGIGIGASHFLTPQVQGHSTYLHNNYVELLACGGIMGFLIYYSAYIYLLIGLFKHKKADVASFSIVIILLSILLIMDYGMVSYYSKSQYFFFMVFFLALDKLKKQKVINSVVKQQ